MEESKNKGMDMFLRMLLMSSGADIIAPQEVQEKKLQALGLVGNEGLEYQAVAKILNNITPVKRVKVLKAALATTLTPSQIMEVGNDSKESIKDILEYTKDHPEARESINPEEALKRLFGADLDID